MWEIGQIRRRRWISSRRGKVGTPFQIKKLKDLPQVYKDMEEMKVVGRVVLRILD